VKTEKEKERQDRITKALNGTLTEDGSMCIYNTYKYINDNIPPFVGERKIAVEDLHDDLIEKQYLGADKETILALIKE
jgi:hypothetical protein